MVNNHFLPFTVVVFKDEEAVAAGLTSIAAYTEGQIMIEDKATAYVCENFSCRAPVTDLRELESIIRS
jgi:uncharacterized protein